MRWLLAPDSYKGSLSADAVATAMQRGIRRADPHAVCQHLPMADGGEGTLDALFASVGGKWLHYMASNAEGARRDCQCLQLPDGTVVLEVARIIGLPQVTDSTIWHRSSRGVGELLKQLLADGHRQVAVALGGSSTNDGGAGCLAALGLLLQDADGQVLSGSPSSLQLLNSISLKKLALPNGLRLEVWSDVDNPLCGERGASFVFGPQKGALPVEVAELDAVINRFACELDELTGSAGRLQPGSGAAGGLGYALQLLGGRLVSGAQAVGQHIGLESALQQADWVLTGEGRSDSQTLSGKAPAHVARLAREAGVPVTLLSGAIQLGEAGQLSASFAGCFSLCNRPMTLVQAMDEAGLRVAEAAEQLARVVLACRQS